MQDHHAVIRKPPNTTYATSGLSQSSVTDAAVVLMQEKKEMQVPCICGCPTLPMQSSTILMPLPCEHISPTRHATAGQVMTVPMVLAGAMQQNGAILVTSDIMHAAFLNLCYATQVEYILAVRSMLKQLQESWSRHPCDGFSKLCIAMMYSACLRLHVLGKAVCVISNITIVAAFYCIAPAKASNTVLT